MPVTGSEAAGNAMDDVVIREATTAPRAELFSMHVMAPWRGQGIGSGLVGRFRAWAEDRGVVQLRVSAYTANEGALRFYQRHGFTPLDTTLTLDI